MGDKDIWCGTDPMTKQEKEDWIALKDVFTRINDLERMANRIWESSAPMTISQARCAAKAARKWIMEGK